MNAETQEGAASHIKPPLSDYERKILAILSEDAGRTTGDIAWRILPKVGTTQQHTLRVRSWILTLQMRGLVRALDDQKPVCWVKVHQTPPPAEKSGNTPISETKANTSEI